MGGEQSQEAKEGNQQPKAGGFPLCGTNRQQRELGGLQTRTKRKWSHVSNADRQAGVRDDCWLWPDGQVGARETAVNAEL